MRRERRARAFLAGALVFWGGAPALAQEADLPALHAAVRANATDAAASFALGKALRRAGRFPEAVLELQRGATLGSAYKNGLNATMIYELARTRLEQRDLYGALRACDGLGKTSAISNACRAEAFLMQNRASEAVPVVDLALKADPSLYEAKVAEGRAFAQSGKVSEAEASLRSAILANDGRSEGHRALGLFFLAQGRHDEGVVELKKAAAGDPADPEIALDLGQAMGLGKDAQVELARATKLRLGYAPALTELARVSFALGDTSAAESAAADAVKADPSQYEAHVVLGKVRVGEKRWDDALKEGEAARKLMASNSGAELVVAEALAGKGDIDGAIVSFQKAFSLDRTDPTPLLQAATACMASGRPTTARGFADKATGEFPKLAVAWITLGDVIAKQNDPPKARAAYETALKCDGAFDRDAVKRKIAALR